MKNDLLKHIKIDKKKVFQIYNPIDVQNIKDKIRNQKNPFSDFKNKINIVSCGRLEKAKNYDLLINCFLDIYKRNKETHLWILGEGKQREELQSLAKKMELSENVHLIGHQSNPYIWYANADLFIFTSLHEGFPNVVLEAIACECPVVSLEHPGGTKEIFEKLNITSRWVKQISWDKSWFDLMNPFVIEELNSFFGINKIIKKYQILFQK